MVRRKAAKKSGGGKFTRCKFVGRRGSKRVAARLVRELKSDGFRAISSKNPGGIATGYDVLSCGRLPAKPRARRRRRR